MAKKKPSDGPKKKRGPKPQVLKIEGDWMDAIGRAMRAGKPPKAKKRRPTYSRA
jgi:hypothetical protein